MNMTRIYINSVNFLKRKGKKKIGCSCFLLKIVLTMSFIQFFVG